MRFLTGLIGFSPLATGTTGLDVADAPGLTAALALAIDAGATPAALTLWQRVERRAGQLLLADLQAGLTLPAGDALPLPTPRAGVTVAGAAPLATGVVLTWYDTPRPQGVSLYSLRAAPDTPDPDARVVVVDLLDGVELLNQAVSLTTAPVPLALDVAPRYAGPQRTFVGLVTTSTLRAMSLGGLTAGATLDLTTAATESASISVVPVGVIGCDLTAYVQQHASRFALPLWHLCAAELLSEKLNSPRTNWLTLHDPKAATELRDALRAAYRNGVDALTANAPGGGPCASCSAAAISLGSLMP